MAKLGIMLAIGPNFSHFLDVPRTDNIFNRRRQLLCLAELAQSGVSVAPHLSAVTPNDWRFWAQYLRENPTITVVAAEFQTGNKNPAEGRRVINCIASLQDRVGRRLHPTIVGGTQYVEDIAPKFETFSLVDSCPFIKAVKRQKFVGQSRQRSWTDTFTLNGQGLEDIIEFNIVGHARWIDERCTQMVAEKGGAHTSVTLVQ